MLPENVTIHQHKELRGAALQKLNLSLTIALSHLIESSTPFRDASNVENMPKGHCHCTTNEIKPGLKIGIQMKLSELSSIYQSLQHQQQNHQKNHPKPKRPTDLWDTEV